MSGNAAWSASAKRRGGRVIVRGADRRVGATPMQPFVAKLGEPEHPPYRQVGPDPFLGVSASNDPPRPPEHRLDESAGEPRRAVEDAVLAVGSIEAMLRRSARLRTEPQRAVGLMMHPDDDDAPGNDLREHLSREQVPWAFQRLRPGSAFVEAKTGTCGMLSADDIAGLERVDWPPAKVWILIEQKLQRRPRTGLRFKKWSQDPVNRRSGRLSATSGTRGRSCSRPSR